MPQNLATTIRRQSEIRGIPLHDEQKKRDESVKHSISMIAVSKGFDSTTTTGLIPSPRSHFAKLRQRLARVTVSANKSIEKSASWSGRAISKFPCDNKTTETPKKSNIITEWQKKSAEKVSNTQLPESLQALILSGPTESRLDLLGDRKIENDHKKDSIDVLDSTATLTDADGQPTPSCRVDDYEASSKKEGAVKQISSKPVLVLDLDETLIHSSLVPRRASDFWIEVVQNNDSRTREVFWVYKRPGVDEFLACVCKYYSVYVFTAGIKEYATQILDRLDPSNTIISGRLFRDECTEIRGQGSFAKDLRKITLDLRRTILVDNTAACFTLQPANGLLIKSWYADTSDRQLDRLSQFLVEIAAVGDLRLMLPEWRTIV